MEHASIGVVILIFSAVGLAAVGAPAIAQDTGNETIGPEVAAFMQTSAADADATVEDGMFEAEYELASEAEKPVVVTNRTDRIQQQVAELQAEHAELQDANGSMHPVAREARLSALAMRIDRLEDSINSTASKAESSWYSTYPALHELRRNASSLAGPEVAEIARGLAGVDSIGPPDWATGASRGAEPGGRR
ncbi:MAG: hypothetical protein U5K37_11215 [Natrialbaceae archaeon]|nr:hypothetical protein [Natrialbaceae archaeon]